MAKIRRAYKKRNLWKRAFQNVSLEEVIKPIYRNFIEPFLENQPLSPQEMIRLWFDTENRHVYYALIKKNVLIPGHVKHPDTNQNCIPPSDKRQAKRDDQIVVRFDDLKPNDVEVEFNGLTFHMKMNQWNFISGSISLVG